ncbi:lipoate protein ligase C-terminal domain-containing protein [Psychrobacter sp. 16-MNA-CIBAN-0192]|uniref:lipoate protein ligase C-terminal domain-containing protein n=1 Tax=Psychrobacter sp. 16-MNA-CIBAN-0192 TaxID=3140448 RepID=UPI0033171E5A
MIEEVIIFSDTLNVRLIDLLKEALTGVKYNKEVIKVKLDDLGKEHTKFRVLASSWLARLMVKNIS